MLSTPAPFPYPGAPAFLRPGGEECRILQRRRDGRLLISIIGISPHHPDIRTAASGNRTVSLRDLAETAEAAVPQRRGGRTRKTPARKGSRR